MADAATSPTTGGERRADRLFGMDRRRFLQLTGTAGLGLTAPGAVPFGGRLLATSPARTPSATTGWYSSTPTCASAARCARSARTGRAVTVLAGAGLEAGSLAWKLSRLSSLGLEGEASLALFTVDHRWLLVLRGAGWVLGVVLAVMLLWRLRRGDTLRGTAPMVWSMLLAFGASELVGRLLFYATAVPLRPPGPFV
ncbi:hypothetical protein [Egicoccus sp. AB-alg2]|uniref:hypothetical protein n=1 Tax=Egicoccus sp. AB-alg2 TaxID=3242693 RepID=UPI00359E0778